MSKHDDLQSKLEQSLYGFSKAKEEDWYINTEEYIVPLTTAGHRFIDVIACSNKVDHNGYAFEIKTLSSQGYLLFWQLRDYLITGHRPILIAPDSFLDKTLPNSPQVPISWIVKVLDTSVVTVIQTNPLKLRLVEDRLPVDDELRAFFEQ